jgi:hypothetical protein
MENILIYIGSFIIFVWGIGHVAATRSVLAGFKSLPLDNYRIILMEWIAEGLTLCFVGVLAALVVFTNNGSHLQIVIWACAIMLLALAFLSSLTGARTSVGPMRACPIVKSVVAALYITANLMP